MDSVPRSEGLFGVDVACSQAAMEKQRLDSVLLGMGLPQQTQALSQQQSFIGPALQSFTGIQQLQVPGGWTDPMFGRDPLAPEPKQTFYSKLKTEITEWLKITV